MKILKTFLAGIFILSVVFVNAQQSGGVRAKADKAYNSGDYYDAITLYKKAYTKEKNRSKRADIVYRIADCYHRVIDFKNQELWYAKAIKQGYKGADAILYLADALKSNGKYPEAIVQYQKYQAANPTDPKGDLGVKSSEQAQKWKDKPTRYRVDNLSTLNTRNADFGAAYSNKDYRHIIYTSTRAEAMGKEDDGGTGEKFQDLFEASVDKKGKWSAPKPLLEPINSSTNEGAATLNFKGQDMYFTRCEFEKGKMGMCEIYFSKRKGQTWDDPKLVSLSTQDSTVVAQPALSPDEQTLYFVSNMEGGQGGYDIWMSKWDKANKKWGAPINLGNKVNTEQDEMFPFMAYDGTLYFSSKGHIGMGGLDIFKTKMAGSSWEEPVNLKYPMNSSADDFAFVSDTTGEDGFLSSNREGGKGNDDLYKWHLAPLIFTVSGKVFDADTKIPIVGAKIELFASDGTNIPFKVDKLGTYKFDLKPETDYKIVATNTNYLSKQFELSTKGMEQSKDFVGDFDFALPSTLKAIELPNILYDLAKWDLRPESKTALDELVQTMNDNPTIVIELGSHTDSRPIPMSNDTLSQHRAESVVNYLIEKGISSERLVAKGYGQRVPRTLDKDMGHFKQGDVMTDAFISKLKTTALREEAHQLNRRTEFKVLRTNYIKGEETPKTKPTIEIVDSASLNKPEPVIEEPAPAVVDTIPPKKVETEKPKKTGPGEIYKADKKDTYGSVAKKYGIDVHTLKTINGIKSEQIYEGMELKVEPDGDYTDFDKKFYTLEKDDKKWKDLAKKLSVNEKELKKMNPQIDEDQFHTGRRIRIAK
jgi:peptidoglycan-associated lipoprotein